MRVRMLRFFSTSKLTDVSHDAAIHEAIRKKTHDNFVKSSKDAIDAMAKLGINIKNGGPVEITTEQHNALLKAFPPFSEAVIAANEKKLEEFAKQGGW